MVGKALRCTIDRNDAGEYSSLIGGVCIPLMASQMVTGKVSFVEKFGTGEPNSTGAYELDLSSINNFTLAWRPMHVKTEVFCSAGLILPDIAGRQINLGGPDGSPGQWGQNDWQENVNEIHLQVARWYPSAMIMANGSLLVIGGETGSNAPAQPTLELLPPMGTSVLILNFLLCTDPNNLYPYIAVLPSGIFIACYNETRILDEITFETIKVLPNILGAVNDAAGARNYPLEGAMMLLPQFEPYDELLTVLICGGSTPGGGYALDNCVSTQPEVENSTWVIERMPSRRVMPCMVALPDGTYLIMNGAHHGVAGFGLGKDPNLNAVLYDPRKPINSRMSIMGNKSVARLYNSEAMLLLDGRVLVSGSDPQDGVNPQEYRVEVFTPTYILSGIQGPTFTLSSKDWTYSQVVSFSITWNFTSRFDVKVSLLGSVVSTHGNSMGQRTLFPLVTCGVNTTCTINAPPNAHVAPPGWYIVFVLAGPTPSEGQCVRIGDDPAMLGKWPNAVGFDLPGLAVS
ncbi:WSC domain-containing protein [Rutstroemia sp. NJR-2017a WRK4]|nr:WSC domain-containing protein [Rutstroemia sp. NJR-2017a WRK4]